MATTRFVLPAIGGPETVDTPHITRGVLDNGLRVESIRLDSLPLVAVTLIVEAGSIDDPPGQHGLVGLTADLVDEGSSGRDAIAVAESWARLGSSLETEVGADVTAFGFSLLSRFLGDALELLAASVCRPTVDETAVTRVREQRLNRLRQLQNSPGAAADRVFLRAVFGEHGYAHTSLGTSAAVASLTRDHVLACHARYYVPNRATLIVVGDIQHDALMRAAALTLGAWSGSDATNVTRSAVLPFPPASPNVWFVDRPGAPQSELRIGHLGVSRAVPDYHALVPVNALLGGRVSSRINQRLRQEKGYTYGARTDFDVRKRGGAFECETSVQRDATVAAIQDVLADCAAVSTTRPPDEAELERTKASVTRGYVRQFETPAQLVRAAAQLLVHDLPDDSVSRFVPSVLAVDVPAVVAAARAHVRAEDMSIVIVGDAARVGPGLSELARTVIETAPEF